jgi:class 3 adenylate cyclase/tetratricopeptide (TPR) repeat protein
VASVSCSACGVENPSGAKFCMACGEGIERSCPGCGAPAQSDARFCTECGTAIADASETGTPAAPGASELAEERRQATILFADLSGYTAVSEQLDPEEIKALVDRALDRLSREVVAHGGHVDKYIGDNVMAVFGAPVAYEDDPERAVRAGLAMQDAMEEINAEISSRPATRGVAFTLRVGVNSGEVLAGHSGGQYTVIGDAVNVAARLQVAAEPGSVTVGPATRRLTATAIEYRDLEPLILKGKVAPIPASEAVRSIALDPGSHPSRPGAELIGRDEELALLVSLFDRVVRESRPHLVTVYGQAGVGKSRLLGEVDAALCGTDDHAETLVGHSPAYGTATAYAALAEIVRNRFEISRTDGPDSILEKLTAGITGLVPAEEGTDATRIASQVARLLGVEGAGENAEGTDVRDRIFAAVRLLLELMSARGPLVIAVEDIHWADEGMLDLIEHLAGWAQGPLLIVCLARDELLERRPSWGAGRRNATTISLDPLSEDEVAELVMALLAGSEEGAARAEEVALRSGGNPLFAEEMVNSLREGTGGDEAELPESVHAVIAARLDGLPSGERSLLQVAAVVGQVFWQRALGELAGESEVEELLAELVRKDLVAPSRASSVAGDREFSFKHALVRDVAYSTLPRALRARQHQRVAEMIEQRVGPSHDGVAAVLAEHRGRAAELSEGSVGGDALLDIRARAARAFAEAGDVAGSLHSNAEAVLHYERALQVESNLDESWRASVLESLGDVAFRSGRVDDAMAAWTEAMAMHDELGDPARTAELRRKVGLGHWQKGDRDLSIVNFQRGIDLLKGGEPSRELVELYEDAALLYLETGDNMLAIYAAEKAQMLSEALGPSSTAARASLTFGRVFGRIGDVGRARESLERSVDLARHVSTAEAIRALIVLGRHLEVVEAGYSEAETVCREALGLADEIGDVPAQIELHAALGHLATYPARWDGVEEHTAAAARLAEREGLSGQLCLPLVLQGILAWRVAEWERSEERLRHAYEIASSAGRSETAFSALLWLGACHRDRGDFAGACDVLAQAASICEKAALVGQLVEASAARAVALGLDNRKAEARETAAGVEEQVGRLPPHPITEASAAEANGVAGDDGAAAEHLREAAEGWERAGRPLDAIRAYLLLAAALGSDDGEAAGDTLRLAATEADRVGVPHLAAAARSQLARTRTSS